MPKYRTRPAPVPAPEGTETVQKAPPPSPVGALRGDQGQNVVGPERNEAPVLGDPRDTSRPLTDAEKAELWERLVTKFTYADGDCWNWHKPVSGKYPHVRYRKVVRNAHRVMYWVLVGPIGPGQVVDHLCRNVRCVHPGHMDLTSNTENIMRGTSYQAKNAAKTHCHVGHPLSPKRDRRGKRRCMECHKARARIKWQTKKLKKRLDLKAADPTWRGGLDRWGATTRVEASPAAAAEVEARTGAWVGLQGYSFPFPKMLPPRAGLPSRDEVAAFLEARWPK